MSREDRQLSTEEQAQTERFNKVYEQGRSALMRDINCHVCGCDFGATSWTTKSEADRIASIFRLSKDDRLLDLGSGAGWPAVYFAKEYGCDALMVDLPQEGLRIARERAAAEGVAENCATLVADAAAMPLPDGEFEMIHHADLLCCLLRKKQVLAECRRVAKSGACMVFTVISVAPGLSAKDHAIVVAGGPEFIDTDVSYPNMLRDTGWEVEAVHDLTGEFLAATERKSDIHKQKQAALVSLLGEAETHGLEAKFQARMKRLAMRHQLREMYVVRGI